MSNTIAAIVIKTNARTAAKAAALIGPARDFVPVARGTYRMEFEDLHDALGAADHLCLYGMGDLIECIDGPAARKVTQEGRVYKTRKGAQNYIDGFLAEADLGWYVIEVTRGHFAIVRPTLPGDERRGDRVYTLPA